MRMIAATAMLITGAAVAQAPDPKPAAAPEEKKICRLETPTGSMVAEKICHTRAEWKEINAANEAQVDRFNTGRRSGGMGGSGR